MYCQYNRANECLFPDAPFVGHSPIAPSQKSGSLIMATLSERFPLNSVLELTVKGQDETIKGVVYCTDEVSQMVVLKKALAHTTLASEIFMISASNVTNQQVIGEAGEEEQVTIRQVNKKALEQQEKKAIRLAEEALQHINQKVRSVIQFSSLLCIREVGYLSVLLQYK